MTFVQVAQSLVTHRKTLRLARLLNIDRYAVVGRLVALWSWCLDNALDGCLGDIETDILADVMGWEGKPGDLVEAMLTAGFLELRDEVFWIHDWDDHMGRLIDRREANAQRMREARARAKEEADKTRAQHVQRTFPARAPARVEKSREEKSRDQGVSLSTSTCATEGDMAATADAAPRTQASETPHDAKITPISKPAAATGKPREPDPIWDALVLHFGYTPSDGAERARWNTATGRLRRKHATPEQIGARCAEHERRHAARELNWTLTPISLDGHWAELDPKVSASNGRALVANAEAHAVADEAASLERYHAKAGLVSEVLGGHASG